MLVSFCSSVQAIRDFYAGRQEEYLIGHGTTRTGDVDEKQNQLSGRHGQNTEDRHCSKVQWERDRHFASEHVPQQNIFTTKTLKAHGSSDDNVPRGWALRQRGRAKKQKNGESAVNCKLVLSKEKKGRRKRVRSQTRASP